jgi:hypothetical protein
MSQGLADGPHGAPRVLQTGCARLHPGSQVLPTRKQECRRSEGARAGWGKVDGCGVRVQGEARKMWDGRAHAAAIQRSARRGRAGATVCAGFQTCSSALDVRTQVIS